jgi:hypothetical protein
VKFWSRSTPEPEPLSTEADSTGGKGRPTPTRKEAQALRKQTLKVPTDPKAAKKAARARAAEERAASRAALLAGDEKALPARDQGPVRGFIRDFVDGRWAAAELFLPLALLVLVFGFIPMPNIQAYVSMTWLFLIVFIMVDTTILLIRLKGELKRRWPADADRKGATMYALMRVLQLRRLRLPPPKVRPGGRPVKPKTPKPAKDAATK